MPVYSRRSARPLAWILAGAALGVALKLFAFDILRVSGKSMLPALRDGERVVVCKLSYGLVKPGGREFFFRWGSPRAGDVVIYLHDDKMVAKRCAAVAGTMLEYSLGARYSLLVDGRAAPLSRSQYERMKNSREVPDGYILALGDNCDESIDSRSYGFVSVKNVVGKVIGK